MNNPAFVTNCSHCRRATRIKVSYLGKQIGCRHCGQHFLATDPDNRSAALEDPVHYWIHFTEREDNPFCENEAELARRPR